MLHRYLCFLGQAARVKDQQEPPGPACREKATEALVFWQTWFPRFAEELWVEEPLSRSWAWVSLVFIGLCGFEVPVAALNRLLRQNSVGSRKA